MLDWTVILTPVVVLGLLLLVGYTGCSLALDWDLGDFLIEVHVPATFAVTAIEYRYTLPNLTEKVETDDNPTPSRAEDSFNVFVYQWNCGFADPGVWVVGCAVVANVAGVSTRHDSRERPEPDPDQPDNDIGLYDRQGNVAANYEVEVIAGGDFRVYFTGYEET